MHLLTRNNNQLALDARLTFTESTDIKLTNGSSYCPDFSLAHVLSDNGHSQGYLTIVVESSLSQSGEDADKKVASMLIFLEGFICLGIVLDFIKTRDQIVSATWSHWVITTWKDHSPQKPIPLYDTDIYAYPVKATQPPDRYYGFTKVENKVAFIVATRVE